MPNTAAKPLPAPFELRYIGQDTPYLDVLAQQEETVAGILAGTAPETLLMVEHPPLYTAGSSAAEGDYLGYQGIPVIHTGRGGKFTYHGPGQRVAYPILDLRPRDRDLRRYISTLQQWLIDSLAEFDITAHTRDEVGVWVDTPQGPQKIAAIGVRVRKWIAFHGIALNIHPDLTHFRGIVPCGISQFGVTSMAALGVNATMAEVDAVLLKNFKKSFFTP